MNITGDFDSVPEGEYDFALVRKSLSTLDRDNFAQWFYRNPRSSASETIRNGWQAKGFEAVVMSPKLDWETVCSSNRTWAYLLHSWEFMDAVMREYLISSDRQLLDWCIGLAQGWIDQYVYNDIAGESSMAWYDMGLGLRSPRLFALIALAFEENYPDSVLRCLLEGAEEHRVQHKLETSFNPRTNHGYYAAVGQVILGKGLYAVDGMKELLEQGEDRLNFMAAAQFLEDGGHSEHSPDYHRMLLDSFKVAIDQNLITNQNVINRIRLASDVLGWMVKPDGGILQFGDSPERTMVSTRKPKSGNPHTDFLLSRGKFGKPNSETLRTLPATGLAFVRFPQPVSSDDHMQASYLAFSASFHSRAHKHADDLNFIWSDHGHEIFVDSGRFGYSDLLPPDHPKRKEGYYYGAPERQYVESTAAHNTVTIDGKNHERRARKPYGSALGDCSARDGEFFLNGHVLHKEWEHERSISFKPSSWLIIEDRVISADATKHDFRSWLNLDAELDVHVHDDKTLMVTGKLFPAPLWVRGWGDLEMISPVKGGRNPTRGWRSKMDRTFVPIWSFGFSLNNSASGTITVTCNFGEEPIEFDPRTQLDSKSE
ncbi:heparinase II/III family protein [Glutamicibacter bergerei]|jgi:hypothetical protein|uniref:Heparinase II/III family protein n=1 Tax=Glutamicibacter bergerei TaxID=256702 RepID=A0ABV9MLR5_9MICC|nr:hypothetical protein [Micrococcaceae bacterium]